MELPAGCPSNSNSEVSYSSANDPLDNWRFKCFCETFEMLHFPSNLTAPLNLTF